MTWTQTVSNLPGDSGPKVGRGPQIARTAMEETEKTLSLPLVLSPKCLQVTTMLHITS